MIPEKVGNVRISLLWNLPNILRLPDHPIFDLPAEFLVEWVPGELSMEEALILIRRRTKVAPNCSVEYVKVGVRVAATVMLEPTAAMGLVNSEPLTEFEEVDGV